MPDVEEKVIPAPHEHDTFLDSSELIINMGPQHPATHGVYRVRLHLDGEKVLQAESFIGYLHRGVEKLGEHGDYRHYGPILDRMDYVASVSNNLAYVETVEKLMAVQVPPRAQYLRVILTELQRIASHLLWLATHALDIGAMTIFMYAFREREKILLIFEKYFGARLTTNSFRIGGLQFDAYEGFEKECLDFCSDFPRRIQEYEQILNENRIWIGRTRGVGMLKAEDAIAWGVTGPVLRGSGVKFDIRKAFPYECYADLDFDVPIGEQGDTYDRYLVRMEEMRQSRRIVMQAIEKLPDGPIMGKVTRVIRPPAGEVYHAIEAPKGELGFFIVSDGTTTPYRTRIRPPSFVNLQALPNMVKGQLVADVVAIIGTIDIVLGEIDR